MNFTSVREPRWADANQSMIDCLVKFDHLKVEVPFTASLSDPEPHGRDIYRRCLSGEFGEVQEYVPTPDASSGALSASPGEVPSFVKGWPEIEEFIVYANTENSSGTVRGIVLVWSAMIEDLLGRLLEAFLTETPKSKELIWKDAHGPLSTFAGRSRLCFSLGLISQRESAALDKIRSVRNEAAHNWNFGSSEAPIPNKVLSSLKALYDLDHYDLFEWKEDNLRYMIVSFYAASCGALAIRLADRQIEALQFRRAVRKD